MKDLNYDEAALLAALPKAPSKYDPYKYYDIAKFRRDLVLQNLKDNKYISKKDFDIYKNSPIKLKGEKLK